MNTKELVLVCVWCMIWALLSNQRFKKRASIWYHREQRGAFSPQQSWPSVPSTCNNALPGHQPPKYINILCMETKPTYSVAITLFLKTSGTLCFIFHGRIWAEVGSPPASPSVRYSLERTTNQLSASLHTQTSSKNIHLPSSIIPQISVQHLLGTRNGDVTGLWITEASNVLKLPEKRMSDLFATILITSV